jgi:hypothetical protein
MIKVSIFKKGLVNKDHFGSVEKEKPFKSHSSLNLDPLWIHHLSSKEPPN